MIINNFIIALAIVYCSKLLSSSTILTFDEIRNIQAGVSKKKLSKSKLEAQKNNKDSKKMIFSNKSKNLKKELKDTKEKLEAYRYVARMQIKTPIIMEDLLIGEGKFLGAQTALGVMASNTVTTLILKNLKGVDLPKGAKVSCQIIAKYKRICGSCNRLIIEGEGIDIQAELKNRDGSNCVIGKIYDGKEKYLTGMMIAEMAKGVLAISQSSIPTIGGSIIESSAKNKVAQGLINGAGETTDFLKEEYQTQEPMVFVPIDTEVIIQFRRKVQI